jgi:hypothetical protein
MAAYIPPKPLIIKSYKIIPIVYKKIVIAGSKQYQKNQKGLSIKPDWRALFKL